jgi:hypothetical protein
LEGRFRRVIGRGVGLGPLAAGLRVGLRTATTVATAITPTGRFVANKLRDVSDKVFVVSRSKREQEKALDVDRFYHQLHIHQAVVNM